MPKVQTGTSLEEDVMRRIKLIAKVDRRSVAEVIAWCVELGLPKLEDELHERTQEVAKLLDKPLPKQKAS